MRIGCPSHIDAVGRSVVAAVDDADGTALFAEKHLAILALHVEITVDEQSTLTKGAPEWLLSVEVEVAMAVNGRTIERIIGTFEMTVLIIRITNAIQRIEVETTNEADSSCYQAIAMDIAHMGLSDGITAFGTIELRIQRIDKINITVIAHGEIFYHQ